MKPFFKVISFILCGFVFIALCGFVWLSASLPKLEGNEKLKGLQAEVRVLRDAHGVPHVFAANKHDAFRALGFLHAQDRLFQMDMTRLAGQGRLAEVLGADLINYDKKMRVLNFGALAKSSFEALSQEVQDELKVYADGVNAALSIISLPPEYTLLGFKPEKWEAHHGLIWAKLMAWQLSGNMDTEIFRTQLLKQGLSREKIDALFPDMSRDAPLTVRPLAQRLSFPSDRRVSDSAARFFERLPKQASNIFVLAGKRTESGFPILVNDPHLQLQAPVLWYLARLNWPTGSVKGASAPGLPYFPLGQNDHVAWGFTTSNMDVQDMVFVDANNKELITREETIKVKGQADVPLVVRSMAAGPVLSDVMPDVAAITPQGKVAVLQFTGLKADDKTPEALAIINAAVSLVDIEEAAGLYTAPPQNLMVADDKGHIAYYGVGVFPRQNQNGRYPTDNEQWNRFDIWNGATKLRTENPLQGVLFNANNIPAISAGGAVLNGEWAEPYRAMRLGQLLSQAKNWDVEKASSVMLDFVSLIALRIIKKAALLFEGETDIARALSAWDGRMDKNAAEPLIFHAFMRHFGVAVFGDVFEADVLWPRYTVLEKAITEKKELVQTSFKAALKELRAAHGQDWTRWRWGDVHRAALPHPVFSRVPFLKNIISLEVETDGDFHTLNRAASYTFTKPYTDDHGAGYRAAYDVGAPDKSLFMIATGQSGHPLSSFYGNMVAPWAEGRFISLHGSENELSAAGSKSLRLHP